MEYQWGLYEADRWHCPLYLQKTINPQPSLPWWLLFGPVSAAQAWWRIGERMWNDSAGVYFAHLDIFFSCDPGEAMPVFLLQLKHAVNSAEIKSTRQRWNEKRVVSCRTVPYSLTSSFSSLRFELCEVQNAFHLPITDPLSGQTL